MIKRFYKQWKSNGVRNILVFVLIFVSSMVLVGIQSSIDSVNQSVEQYKIDMNVEDLHLNTANALGEETYLQLSNKVDNLEDTSYIDYVEDGITFRVFSVRENVNKISLLKGSDIQANNQVIIGMNFFEKENYNISDKVLFGKTEFDIVGYGISPDYITNLKNTTDAVANSNSFCIAFVSNRDFEELKLDSSEKITYNYSVVGSDIDISEIKKIVNGDNLVISTLEARDNPRISNYTSDTDMTKQISTIICICLIIIIAFILGVYLGNIIKKESSAIGTLLALGINKMEILMHYLLLPTLLVFISSIIGTLTGFVFGDVFVDSIVSYYNFPYIVKNIQVYQIAMSVMLPNLLVIVVGSVAIMKRLSFSPLLLIRGSTSCDKIKNKNASFSCKGSIKRRMSVREINNNSKMYLLLAFGELLVIFLLMFSLLLQNSLSHYMVTVETETKYDYLYSVKDYKQIPTDNIDNDNIEKVHLKNSVVTCESANKKMAMTIIGLQENNMYYDFSIDSQDAGFYISSSVSQKFELNKGDLVTFTDPVSEKTYSIECSGVFDYSNGLYAFMNIKQMNTFFDLEPQYYNALQCSQELDLGDDLIYETISSKQILNDVEQLLNRLLPLCYIVIIIGIVVFVGVMLLMLKLIINSNQVKISMLGVLGYNNKEISRIYFKPIVCTIMMGLLVGICISYYAFTMIWPNLIMSMQTFIDVYCSISSLLIIVLISVFALIIGSVLFKKLLNRINFTDVLKARE